MTTVLYTFDHEFMRKTVEAVDRHVDASSAYLPLRSKARGSSDAIREIEVADEGGVEATIREVDPDVVVRNHRFRPGEFDVDEDYPTVHLRHGASVGRGEIDNTVTDLGPFIDLALAPGERWAVAYREGFPADVDVSVVGIPEADDFVGTDPPREKRVLYAPTNHNYGGGSYLNTAEDVLDVFAGSDFELLFRPHPMDREEEPGRSLTERCRERIEGLPNVTFDDRQTPRKSIHESDLLISDYSGIIPEWLHTGRPFVQVTDLAADDEVPAIGSVTDDLDLELLQELYEYGYPPEVEARQQAFLEDLGIPMDGRAGQRAADEVMACTE